MLILFTSASWAVAVSHAIGALEDRLGVRLLARTTRSVAATDAGRRLLARLEPALHEIEGAVEDLGEARGAPSGTLRLTLPRTAVKQLIMPRYIAGSSRRTARRSKCRSRARWSSTIHIW